MRLTPIATGVVVAALAGGCREAVAPPSPAPELPESARPLAPPAVYAYWWQATEECAGRRGTLARVSWFVVPESDWFAYRGGRYDGYWWNHVHWITLAAARVQDPAIVRHEMLHDLLGRGDHPAEYFQFRCRAVVACNEDCRTDD